ncbi:MAG TPA: 16S rRNA (cytosine(967)-C(5))-methyltransferase RsmB [Chitinispirillaceae bacterium]|nr:16S rRNA (cytosine(967)-C(5))-methyltransferase RsmB [Chitinispirillaceae bacterium]
MRPAGYRRTGQREHKKSSPRQLILNILCESDKNKASLDHIIDSVLKGSHIDHRDRRFIFEIVYGILRHKFTIDYIIDHYLSEENNQKDENLYRILRIGIYQLLYMSKVPDHAAVNESVMLAKADQKTIRYSSVVNAIMRAFINNKKIIPLPDPQKNLLERLSVEYSHPGWIVQRWLKNYGLAKTKQILTFNNERPPIFLRRKLREISRQQFEADVRNICEPASGYLNLYYKLKKSLLPENIQIIQHGLCNVQTPSSGWVVALLDIQRGEHLLDLCAAPGGKTALMAELTTESGTVCACELKWNRLMSVVETSRRMNLLNIYPLICDGANPPFNGLFDKILLDAPCSGTGVFHRHPDARWIRQEEDITSMAEKQKKLLNSAATLVEKNGIIVYSTCSLEPEENQQQIENFLREHPSFRLDNIPDTIPDRYKDDKGYLMITPFEQGMDAMFGARLKRIA